MKTDAGHHASEGAFTPFEELAHTADWSLRVRGRSLEQLFANAALGVSSLVAECSQAAPAADRRLEVTAATVHGLLITWLNELLFITDVEGLVCCQVQQLTLQPPGDLEASEWARLEAQVSLVRPAQLLKAVKAITHHYATIRQVARLYEVDLVLDV